MTSLDAPPLEVELDRSVRAVDACVHVMPGSKAELLEFLPEPWRSRTFPGPERYNYALARGEYSAEASRQNGLPGSEISHVVGDVLARFGSDLAVLVPLTRGMHPNINLATALCAATNDWLAARWLDAPEADGRFYGSIRVEPRDPLAAVREIERWAGHPRMVQVAVPTQAWQPYGAQTYLPIWRAAASHGLPVCIHADGGAGVDFPPTPTGYLRFGLEYACLHALSYGFHLASLIAEGTFSWADGLVVVFADGGYDTLWPLVWRLDKDWRGNRDEVPATHRVPSSYLRDHVRFVAHHLEGPPGASAAASWLDASEGAAELLLFGSNYPQWDMWSPAQAAATLPSALQDPILSRNSRSLYRLPD